MARYKNDPYPLTAKFSGKCHKCGKPINKGEAAYYWPKDRHILCTPCGEPEYRQFEAAAQDEEIYNSCY